MVPPSPEEMFLIDSPSGFAALLARDDLSEVSAGWWTAAISACSSCLTLAAAGDTGPQPIEWARVLVSVLEAASNSGLIKRAELLARRVAVQAAALLDGRNDFGDANEICARAFEEMVGFGENVQSVANEVRDFSERKLGSALRISDLAALRKVVRTLESIRDSISEDEIRSELNLWSEAFNPK